VFVDNVLDRGPPLRNVETDRIGDYLRPVSGILSLLSILSGLLGI